MHPLLIALTMLIVTSIITTGLSRALRKYLEW
jgi:hypothetical protein